MVGPKKQDFWPRINIFNFLKLCPIFDKLTFIHMLFFGQKTCFIGSTIFEIPEPNWQYYICTKSYLLLIFQASVKTYRVYYRPSLLPWCSDLMQRSELSGKPCQSSFVLLQVRVRPRFFDQVGHETMYASSGNKHFFTKSCHRQTYQKQCQQKLGTILENQKF